MTGWKQYEGTAETEQPEPTMESTAPEPPTVAETTTPTESVPEEAAPPEPAAPVAPEIDPALKRQQELEARYAQVMGPMDKRVAEWDFAGAAVCGV